MQGKRSKSIWLIQASVLVGALLISLLLNSMVLSSVAETVIPAEGRNLYYGSAPFHPGVEQSYTPPRLRTPRNNGRVFYPTRPTLSWTAAGRLQSADYYVVRIEYPNGQGVCEKAVKETRLIVPDELIKMSSFAGRFSWSVSVRRQTGEITDCTFAGDILVKAPAAWKFAWAKSLLGGNSPGLNQTAVPSVTGTVGVLAPQPGNNATFPCSVTALATLSNLCVLPPYPVPAGTTAQVVWNIKDFREGAFDSGDGRGLLGPIAAQMNVTLPNVREVRILRLRWKDAAGHEYIDSFRLSLGPAPKVSATVSPTPFEVIQITVAASPPPDPSIDQPTVAASPPPDPSIEQPTPVSGPPTPTEPVATTVSP